MKISKRASIDIGSNSTLLLIAEVKDDNIRILENEANITGLGRDLDLNNRFIEEAMNETFDVLKHYASLCLKHGIPPNEVVITATEASRVAENSHKFFNFVFQKTNLKINIITAEAEAFYSATGVMFDDTIKDEVITIMDIGGASTELIQVNTKLKKVIKSFSMPVGVVRMNNWHENGDRSESLNKILSDFSENLAQVKCNKLYCVAGTMTSIGNMKINNKEFIESEVNGLVLKLSDLDGLIASFREHSAEDFLCKHPFLGKRSKTIMSGLVLAYNLIELLGAEEIFISTYGLRYGTLLAGEIRNDFIEGK